MSTLKFTQTDPWKIVIKNLKSSLFKYLMKLPTCFLISVATTLAFWLCDCSDYFAYLRQQ